MRLPRTLICACLLTLSSSGAVVLALDEPGKDAKKPAAPDPSAATKKDLSSPSSYKLDAFLGKYCTGCHGASKPKADLNLAQYSDENSVVRARKLWGRVKEFVEEGEMPPEDKKQPSQEELEAFTKWIDSTLSKVDCTSQGDPGRVTIKRLNRSEYNNTIRDLIGIDFRPADDFPSDDVGQGFDNLGDVLTLPPILFEKYLEAAEKIAEQAIDAGDGSKGTIKTYEAEDLPEDAGGNPYSDSARILPSTGAIVATHAFPRDAEYILRVRAFAEQAGPEPAKMEFQIDGKPLKTVEVKAVAAEPKVYEFQTKLRGGTRKFGAAFINDFYDEKIADASKRDRNLVIDYLEVQGPIASKNSPLSDSHKRIIFKKPGRDDRSEVAREIVEKFASRAYRRPLSPGEVARILKFVDLAHENGDSFERGIQLAVQAILVSPQFLFRVELDRKPPTAKRKNAAAAAKKAPESFPVSDFELASRLSYFLWSSMPDDELSKLARDKKLHEEEILEKQVRRMLHDPKAKALVENFADQWLQIRNLKTVNPDRGRFPSFDEPLRAAMLKETELFFEAVIKEDRSILDLIDSDFTFVNERLAKHYGIEGIKGDAFHKVALKGGQGGRRGGILTQASVLTVTSNPTRTSPVKRGKWILEQILGTPPPPPPPDVPELDDQGELKGSLRERMVQHRANTACASCHARMDPLGFGFENYDAIGAWRDKDESFNVDASGELPTGQKFQGPTELKSILKTRDKDFARCLAEKMLTFAIGRGVEYYDTCAIDKIVEGTAGNQFRFSRLILEIVKSDPFQKRRGRG